MDQNGVIRFRANEAHCARLEQLSRATGTSVSRVLRLLVENAELKLLPTPAATIELEEKNRGAESVTEDQGTPTFES